MNKKIDLASLKGNEGALVAIAMVLLAVILGVAVYFTVGLTVTEQKKVYAAVETANLNVQRIEELKSIKADQEKYVNDISKYDAVIADSGTYTKLGRQAELEDLLVKYNLMGTVISTELVSFASVQTANSTINVVGQESDIKAMCKEIVSPKYVVRIDSFSMADNGDGTVTAEFVVVDFTK